MDNDCQQLEDRLRALSDQRKYLNEQLKAILKRNRVLQAEIGLSTRRSNASLVDEHGAIPLSRRSSRGDLMMPSFDTV
jgi:uncharacterized protein (DUF3084 family)